MCRQGRDKSNPEKQSKKENQTVRHLFKGPLLYGFLGSDSSKLENSMDA